ncbi:Vesicle transport protein GOT1A, partial [Coemansia sp. RSA 2598]
DLREESDLIMGGLSASTRTRTRPEEGVRHGSRTVNGVEIAYDTALLASANFASADVLESVVARACRGARISRVSEEVIPLLTLALHERLRSYMELVSAAAHHRTRTQTLPPPPLDPTTRLPLYKITPHQDVKRQLAVIERRDRMCEQMREKALRDREHFNETGEVRVEASGEPGAAGSEGAGSGLGTLAGPGGDDAADAAGKSKRPRKRDDSAPETPAYTSKNMPEDIRNKFSNQTALRAAGGVRKSWMNVASKPDWLTSTPATPAYSSLSKPASSSGGDAQDAAASDAGAAPASGHKRGQSSLGTASEFDAAPETPISGVPSSRPPPALISHRSTSLAAPLLITVRDCLFSLERERLGSVRVGRGSGDR